MAKTVTFTIDSPITPVNEAAVNSVMDTLLAADVFLTLGQKCPQKKGARIVERTVAEVKLN
ncbi:DUF2922 domain-containing protein [Ectobacillus funiculus]